MIIDCVQQNKLSGLFQKFELENKKSEQFLHKFQPVKFADIKKKPEILLKTEHFDYLPQSFSTIVFYLRKRNQVYSKIFI